MLFHLIKSIYVGMRLINSPSTQEPSHCVHLNEVLNVVSVLYLGQLSPDNTWSVLPARAVPPCISYKEMKSPGQPLPALEGVQSRAQDAGGLSKALLPLPVQPRARAGSSSWKCQQGAATAGARGGQAAAGTGPCAPQHWC